MDIIATIKGGFKSLTIWANAVFTTVVVSLPLIQESIPALQEHLPGNVYKWLAVTVIVSNIILRIKTNKPLAEK